MVRITNIVIITILLLILLIPYTLGAGTCSLDKYKYNPGEIATFQCSCSLLNEENQDGYIVFQQDNGTILSSVATNSGSCRTSLFGGSYIFQSGADFLGNTTFSLNSNGTGIPPNWDGIGDINFDIFNVSGASITDCIISDVKVPSLVNLGIQNANVFKVSDGITGNPIVGINCMALSFAADDSPILIEPYGKNYDHFRTVAGGTGYLTSDFFQERFEKDTTYEFNLYCQCTNNSENDAVCYDDTTGERLGFRSCSVTGLFTTGEDYRPYHRIKDNLLSYIFSFVFFSVILFIIGIVNSGEKAKTIVKTKKGDREIFDVSKWRYWAMYSAFSFAVIELVLLSGFIYGMSIELRMELLLQINFWFMLIISVFLFILTMVMNIVQLFTFREVNTWGEKW